MLLRCVMIILMGLVLTNLGGIVLGQSGRFDLRPLVAQAMETGAVGGHMVAVRQTTGLVDVRLEPASANLMTGETLVIETQVVAGSTGIDGAAFYLGYDPLKFQVVDATGTPTTTVELIYTNAETSPVVVQNQVNPETGQIDFAMVFLGTPPTGTLSLIRFRLLARPGSQGLSTVSFHSSGARDTEVTSQGASVIGNITGGNYSIVGPTPTPGVCPLAWDLANNDNLIDVQDVMALVNLWRQPAPDGFDFTGDDFITVSDIQVVAGHWGEHCQ